MAVAVVAALVAWEVYVMTVMWDWFVAPMFNLDTPNMATMGGLYFFWLLLPKSRQASSDPAESPERMARSFLRPAVILFIGWVLA